jgi:hypothetical protein
MSHLERLKQAKRELAAERQAVCEASYRAMLRRAFELVAQGSEASRAECAQVLDRLAALTDDIGVTRTDAIRDEERARWRAETGWCPYCGYHER